VRRAAGADGDNQRRRATPARKGGTFEVSKRTRTVIAVLGALSMLFASYATTFAGWRLP
jgi:hypothetical protein